MPSSGEKDENYLTLNQSSIQKYSKHTLFIKQHVACESGVRSVYIWLANDYII